MPCVYVLSNPSFPELYKIGYTYDSASARAIVLHTTGVPSPFKVEREWQFVTVNQARKAEAFIHHYYSESRHINSREFFKVSLSDLDQIIKDNYPEVFEDLLKRKEKQRFKEAQEKKLLEDIQRQRTENNKQNEIRKLMIEWEKYSAYINSGYPNWEYRSEASESLIRDHRKRLDLAEKLYQLGAKENGIQNDSDHTKFKIKTSMEIEKLEKIISDNMITDHHLREKRHSKDKIQETFLWIVIILFVLFAINHC
jgi:hypothetical protein